MKRRSLLQGCALLTLATALVGCNDKPSSDNTTPTTPVAPTKTTDTTTPSSSAGGGTYKIIVNGISPFWDTMGKGMDAGVKELDVKSTWQAPTPPDHNGQVKLFNDTLSAKVDGIAISPIQADAIAPTINKAIDEGTPVICFDSDAVGSKRLAYIGTNNFEAGKAAGLVAAKMLPNGGKLVAFVGNMGAQNAQDRYKGFKEGLKGTNIVFLAEPFEDNKDKSKARKNVEDVITKYQAQGLNGLVGLYSYNGPAIVGAVEAAGITRDKMKVFCFDAETETIKNLAANKIDVTVVQKPYEFGRLSLMLLKYIHQDKSIDKALQDIKPELDKQHMTLDAPNHSIDTGVDVVTPENSKAFLQKLKEKGLESS